MKGLLGLLGDECTHFSVLSLKSYTCISVTLEMSRSLVRMKQKRRLKTIRMSRPSNVLTMNKPTFKPLMDFFCLSHQRRCLNDIRLCTDNEASVN